MKAGKQGMFRKLRLPLFAAVMSLLVVGCTTNSGNQSGMMNSSSKYYQSKQLCEVPSDLPGAIVKVSLEDMGMTQMMGGTAPLSAQMRLSATPSEISGPTVSIVVSNYGWRTHELVVLPLAANQNAGERIPEADGQVDESGNLGEASNDCGAGVGEGVKAGSATWITLKLKPGRYEFICNLKNHYADGMYQEVVVS